jgi:hypothetical protein
MGISELSYRGIDSFYFANGWGVLMSGMNDGLTGFANASTQSVVKFVSRVPLQNGSSHGLYWLGVGSEVLVRHVYNVDMLLDPNLWRCTLSKHACWMCRRRLLDNGGEDIRAW